MKKFWDMVALVAAIIILVGTSCYAAGVNCNLIIVGFFLAGAWAVQYLAARSAISDLIKNLSWYAGTFLVVSGSIFIFFRASLLGMYNSWAVFDGSIWGAARLFTPFAVVTVAAVMIASQSKEKRTWSKRAVIFFFIMNALGLMAYELVGPFDLWVTAKKLLAAQKLGEDRLRTIDATGTYVIPRATGRAVWSYKPDWGDKANFFSRDRLLVAGLRYPVCRLEDVRSDGAYRLIPIAIPDKNDEYTARADERWVRLEEVDILQGREPFSVVKSADGKAWTVTFYTDVPVKVADLRPGQAYIISGAAKKELQWPDNQNAEKLLFVPQGVKLTAETATEIRLKHKPGGRVNILFL